MAILLLYQEKDLNHVEGLEITVWRTFSSYSYKRNFWVLNIANIISFWSKEGRHRKRLQNVTKFWMDIYSSSKKK